MVAPYRVQDVPSPRSAGASLDAAHPVAGGAILRPLRRPGEHRPFAPAIRGGAEFRAKQPVRATFVEIDSTGMPRAATRRPHAAVDRPIGLRWYGRRRTRHGWRPPFDRESIDQRRRDRAPAVASESHARAAPSSARQIQQRHEVRRPIRIERRTGAAVGRIELAAADAQVSARRGATNPLIGPHANSPRGSDQPCGASSPAAARYDRSPTSVNLARTRRCHDG